MTQYTDTEFRTVAALLVPSFLHSAAWHPEGSRIDQLTRELVELLETPERIEYVLWLMVSIQDAINVRCGLDKEPICAAVLNDDGTRTRIPIDQAEPILRAFVRYSLSIANKDRVTAKAIFATVPVDEQTDLVAVAISNIIELIIATQTGKCRP